jgi:ATP synthase protein I
MIINFKVSRTFGNNATGKPLMTRKRPWKMETRKIMALASLGLMLPSSIAVGLLIGYLLDKILGTRPWLLLVFLFFGTASGLYSLLRGLSRFQDENEAEDTKI